MAESAVQFLFEKLTALLAQEASLLRGVFSEVEEIKRELDSMRAFLRDADRRKDSNEGVRAWVGQVRDAAYEVEDIIDEFMYRMDKQRRGGLRGFLVNTIRLPKKFWHRHRLATQLQETKGKIQSIYERRVRFELDPKEEGTSSYDVSKMWQRDVETSLSKKDDIVGMKKEIDMVDMWLVEEDQRRTVISVTGMGGVGKTALVTKVYKNQQVKKHFDCFAHVSVSQTLRIDELLRSIIKQIREAEKDVVPNDLGTKDAGELRRMVGQLLESKKYLIVLDDIWRMDDWNQLNDIFSDYRCGSRLLVTTRYENVARAMGGEGKRVCTLQPLDEGNAWDLFCKQAFWNEPCPSELKQLAGSIVEKCDGLPLAVVCMGRLLAVKDKTVSEWKRIYDDLSSQLQTDQTLEPIKRILLLSFWDLPYRLKHCFLYCCTFPEDYLIRCGQLIRLWVAEGFVEETVKITMEERAEEYLKELIHRNVLQVFESDRFERLKACRMHDIVREVALLVCKEEKFCMTFEEQQARQDDKVRRMSIHTSEEIIQSRTDMRQQIIQSRTGMRQLRSLMVFDERISFSSLNTMTSSFRLLRVLNLGGVSIESVPDELTNLFNLRYLNLRETNVRELPKSLGRLVNLQTLDVRGSRIKRLPNGVVKLRKLRHIFGYRYNMKDSSSFHFFSGIQVPVGICKITSLQSLQAVEGEEGQIVRQVGKLTQLRRLSISKVREIDGDELCAAVGKMKHLLKLIVTATREEETLKLEALSFSDPPLLQKLYLNGRLEKVPQWFSSLVNLNHLSLSWSKLREDPLSSLQALSNLVELILHKASEGQKLCFRNGWFPKLRRITLSGLTQLNRIVMEKGALPDIQELHLNSCGELKTLPEGIEYLTRLQRLFLVDMPMELTGRLQPKDGSEEDRRKVGHILLIVRAQMTEEGWVTEILN